MPHLKATRIARAKKWLTIHQTLINYDAFPRGDKATRGRDENWR